MASNFNRPKTPSEHKGVPSLGTMALASVIFTPTVKCWMPLQSSAPSRVQLIPSGQSHTTEEFSIGTVLTYHTQSYNICQDGIPSSQKGLDLDQNH